MCDDFIELIMILLFHPTPLICNLIARDKSGNVNLNVQFYDEAKVVMLSTHYLLNE